MDERMPLVTPPKTRAEYRAAIQGMLAEIRRLFAEMDQNYAEMEQRRVEFETVRARTDANLRALEEQ